MQCTNFCVDLSFNQEDMTDPSKGRGERSSEERENYFFGVFLGLEFWV